MNQMNLFGEQRADTTWKLFVDGAARNNPGPAGIGIVLIREDVPVLEQGFYIGERTNNQAEYMALLIGVCQARGMMKSGDLLEIRSDSELLVRQITGHYGVKDHTLKVLYQQVVANLQNISYRIAHVRRELNTIADALANAGIDGKIPVPPDIWQRCAPESW
jgi:ribonuclease HI